MSRYLHPRWSRMVVLAALEFKQGAELLRAVWRPRPRPQRLHKRQKLQCRSQQSASLTLSWWVLFFCLHVSVIDPRVLTVLSKTICGPHAHSFVTPCWFILFLGSGMSFLPLQGLDLQNLVNIGIGPRFCKLSGKLGRCVKKAC